MGLKTQMLAPICHRVLSQQSEFIDKHNAQTTRRKLTYSKQAYRIFEPLIIYISVAMQTARSIWFRAFPFANSLRLFEF